MNLQELKDKGVKQLTVKNGVAIAVNPYDEDNGPFYKAVEVHFLPSIPCPSVADRVYEIGQFEELVQVISLGEWNDLKVNKIEFSYDGRETRTVLILKEQIPERLNDYASRYAHLQDQQVERTAEEISQWVINNRYAKSEFEKVSDFEMFHELTEQIKEYASLRVQEALSK